MNSQFTAEEIRKGISEGTIQLFPKTNGVSECWKYFSEANKDDKILFGWAVCKSCFISIPKFYGTKNLSDHLKNCRRTPSPPSINNYSKSKQGNIKIQQSDKDLMKENLKMVVCGGTSFTFLENQGFQDTISHAIQIGTKYDNIQASDVLYARVTIREHSLHRMRACKDKLISICSRLKA